MMLGYGYRRDADELRKAGAEQVWVDFSPDRLERADLFRSGALRPGDTLVLFSLRDLGGSPKADPIWQRKVEERGASIKIVDLPARKLGRPRRYDPTPDQVRRHRAIWLDGDNAERARLKAIAADYGSHVTRSTLHGRYGSPSNPKPERQAE